MPYPASGRYTQSSDCMTSEHRSYDWSSSSGNLVRSYPHREPNSPGSPCSGRTQSRSSDESEAAEALLGMKHHVDRSVRHDSWSGSSVSSGTEGQHREASQRMPTRNDPMRRSSYASIPRIPASPWASPSMKGVATQQVPKQARPAGLPGLTVPRGKHLRDATLMSGALEGDAWATHVAKRQKQHAGCNFAGWLGHETCTEFACFVVSPVDSPVVSPIVAPLVSGETEEEKREEQEEEEQEEEIETEDEVEAQPMAKAEKKQAFSGPPQILIPCNTTCKGPCNPTRSVVAHYIGRNKGCKDLIPKQLLPMTCRKMYQRTKYKWDKTGQYYIYQADLLAQVVDRTSKWYACLCQDQGVASSDVSWTIQMTKGVRENPPANPIDAVIQQACQAANLLGQNKSTWDVYNVINVLKAQIVPAIVANPPSPPITTGLDPEQAEKKMKEYESWISGKPNLGGVEFLATGLVAQKRNGMAGIESQKVLYPKEESQSPTKKGRKSKNKMEVVDEVEDDEAEDGTA